MNSKLENTTIIEDFLSGMSLRSVAKKHGVSPFTAKYFLNSKKIDTKRRYYPNHKYNFNEHWLDNLDSQEKWYFLGLFAADGNINKRDSNASIGLIQEDKKLLEEINSLLDNERPVIDRERNGTYNGGKQKDSYFQVSSKYFCERLTQLGFPPNKTLILDFPDYITEKYLPHFIRGYLDGDGCISLIKKNKEKYEIKSNFVGSKKFIEKLANILKCHGIDCILDDKRSENYSVVEINRLTSVTKMLEWLYKDATIKMERKYNKYLEFLEHRDLTIEDFGSKKRRLKQLYPIIFKEFEEGDSITFLSNKHNIKHSTIYRNLLKEGYRVKNDKFFKKF